MFASSFQLLPHSQLAASCGDGDLTDALFFHIEKAHRGAFLEWQACQRAVQCLVAERVVGLFGGRLGNILVEIMRVII